MALDTCVNSDVILKVGEEMFPCQREVLSRSSPYFEAMFSHNFIEKEKNIIEIQNVDSEAMKTLLHFIETSEIPKNILKSAHILPLLQASSMLQFEPVQKMCINIIANEWLSVDTCFQTMATANVLDIVKLHRKAKALAFWEFSTVKTTNAFFDLPIEAIEEYLNNDGLNTKQGEFEVFDAGLNWLQEDPEGRKKHLLRILQCIRFSDISASDIRTMFLYPCVAENIEALNILHCILALKSGNSLSTVGSQKDLQLSTYAVNDKCSKVIPKKKRKSLGKKAGCSSVVKHKTSQSNVDANTPNSSNTGDSEIPCHILPTENKKCVCHSRGNEVQCTCSRNSLQTSSDATALVNEAIDNAARNEHSLLKAETNIIASQLLNKSRRLLPLVPCVVGHKVDDGEKLNCKTNSKAYIIYFDKKTEEPIPFIHLAKVNEGPVEPSGYRVINKGQDLYIIGGEYLLGYGNWNNTIWKYDAWREEWTYETCLLSPRRHHSTCVVDDDIYIIGGFGRHRVIMDSVDKYNVISKVWRRCSPLPRPMYSAACCAHKGIIYVFGFEVCCYEVGSDTWRVFRESPVPPNMTVISAVSHEDWIYLTDTYTSELLRYCPSATCGISSCHEVPAHQILGSFKHRPSCTCIANNIIYCFTTNEQGRMFIEVYDIVDNKFEVLWEGGEYDSNGIVDFSPKHCIGCFPMIMY